jgi:carboxyl-terminal processing protease
MKSLPFSKIRTLILLTAFAILAAGIGYQLGERKTTVRISPEKRVVINQEAPPSVAVDFALFWDVWARLHQYYIDPAKLDAQNMLYGAITGMVSALGDPYTAFLPPKENQEFKEDLGGAFEGIGAQLGLTDGRVSVVAPLKGTPAEKAGIRPGDLILKVDGVETIGWTVPQAVAKIRGPKGTSVKLEIYHDGASEPEELTVVRAAITVPSVVSWIKTPSEIKEISGLPTAQKTGKIAYLQLSRFGDQTNSEWTQAVADLVAAEKANGTLSGLVFDLRSNPGGYLDGAVFVASEFLRNGIVVSQVNSDGSREDYEVNRKGSLLTIPLVILINKGSASASEIAAGALKDHKRATVVGEKSFGKGTVQTPQDLTGGAGLHITTGKWLLPSGATIQDVGITPDVEVALDPAVSATQDAQLARAIELLLAR